MNADSDVTRLLDRLAAGTATPGDEATLYDRLYGALREIASHLMRLERGDHTLQPTALVHEAYLRLVRSESLRFQSRQHFLALAATIMRRVLTDHARCRDSVKRGRDVAIVGLDVAGSLPGVSTHPIDVLALDAALQALEAEHDRMARVVELRLFSGMAAQDIADFIGVSRRTVDGDWAFAVRWLSLRLADDSAEDAS